MRCCLPSAGLKRRRRSQEPRQGLGSPLLPPSTITSAASKRKIEGEKKKITKNHLFMHIRAQQVSLPGRVWVASSRFWGGGSRRWPRARLLLLFTQRKNMRFVLKNITPGSFFPLPFFYRGAMVAFGAGRKVQAAPDEGLELLEGLLQ